MLIGAQRRRRGAHVPWADVLASGRARHRSCGATRQRSGFERDLQQRIEGAPADPVHVHRRIEKMHRTYLRTLAVQLQAPARDRVDRGRTRLFVCTPGVVDAVPRVLAQTFFGPLQHAGRFCHAHRLQLVADLHLARHRRRQLAVHPPPRVNAVLRQSADEVFFREAQQLVTPFATVAHGKRRHRRRRIREIRLDDLVSNQIEELRPRFEQFAIPLLELLQASLQYLRCLVLCVDRQQAVRVRQRITEQRPRFFGNAKHLLGDCDARLRRCEVEFWRVRQHGHQRRVQRLDAIEHFGERRQIGRERRALRARVFAGQVPTRPFDPCLIQRCGHVRLRLPADL